MVQTTYQRNCEMLKHYCEGISVPALMTQYNLTKAMVQSGMRQALATIKEHTDYNAEVSFDPEIFPKNKNAILQYMQERIPTTPITQKAKLALRETFGEHYGLHPEKVYAGWEDFPLTQSRYHHYRDLESVRTWLASEGYLVDDYLDQATINASFNQILATLKKLPTKEGINIKITDGTYDRRVMYVDTIVSQGEHQASRRFKLELLPAY